MVVKKLVSNPPKIDLTAIAVQQAKQQLEKRGTPNAALRLGVKGSGCSGFSYHLQFDDDPAKEKDISFNFDGLIILIDKRSLLMLNGLVLDWEQSLIKKGFKFINPNEKSKCGCGNSFNI